MHHPTDRITHTMTCVTPVVDHWLGPRNSSVCPPRRVEPSCHEQTTLPTELHLARSRSLQCHVATRLSSTWRLEVHGRMFKMCTGLEQVLPLSMGYSFQLAARDLLYSTSHRQDNTYHILCYNNCEILAGTKNSKHF